MNRRGMNAFASTSFSVSAAALSGHMVNFAPVRCAGLVARVSSSKLSGLQPESYSFAVCMV